MEYRSISSVCQQNVDFHIPRRKKRCEDEDDDKRGKKKRKKKVKKCFKHQHTKVQVGSVDSRDFLIKLVENCVQIVDIPDLKLKR